MICSTIAYTDYGHPAIECTQHGSTKNMNCVHIPIVSLVILRQIF